MNSQANNGSARTWNFIVICLLAFAVAAAYGSAVSFDFVYWDDDINIYGNSRIQELSVENVRWMFTDIHQAMRYKPLTWLAWAVIEAAFGLKPSAFHLANIVLHASNAALLFVLLKKIIVKASRDESLTGDSTRVIAAAGIGALIWAIHPMRTEPVVWATGLPYCLSTFFLLVSALCYLENRIRLSIGAFAVSMLAYPIGAGFAASLVIWDAYALHRGNPEQNFSRNPVFRKLLLQKLSYFAVVFVFLGITLYGRLAAQSELYLKAETLDRFSLADRLMQAGYVWTYYLWKPLIPISLTPAPAQLISFDPASLAFVASAVFLALSTGLLIFKRKSWPGILAIWLVYLALVVPALGLTEHPHFPSDRYSYVSAIATSIVIAMAALQLIGKTSVLRVMIAGFSLSGALFAMSFQQTYIWKDSRRLLGHILDHLDEIPYKGFVYFLYGDYELLGERPAKAVAPLRQAVRLAPHDVRARHALGTALLMTGETKDGVETLEVALVKARLARNTKEEEGIARTLETVRALLRER